MTPINPTSLLHFIQRKRAIWALVALVLTAIYFWSQSRYPQLNDKALAADSLNLEELITMFPLLPPGLSDNHWQKVGKSILNWIYSNRQGMFFGLIFASLMRMIFSYVDFKGIKNKWLSILVGMIFGAPLGVCVNCAAPIYRSTLLKNRVEMSLALMLSSPTLNSVVLSMMFTLLPKELIAFKLIYTLMAIFIVIPWASKIDPEVNLEPFNSCEIEPALATNVSNQEGWLPSLAGAFLDFLITFRATFLATVPWMIGAAVIGAVLVNSTPLNWILSPPTNFPFITFLCLVATTLFGLLIPTPMAFDIFLVNALSRDDFHPAPMIILLSTLGIFSVYSFIIIWKSSGKRLAIRMAIGLFVLGLAMGYAKIGLDHFRKYYQTVYGAINTEGGDLMDCFGGATTCEMINNLSRFENSPGMVKLPKIALPNSSAIQGIYKHSKKPASIYIYENYDFLKKQNSKLNDHLLSIEIDQSITDQVKNYFSKDKQMVTIDITFRGGKGLHRQKFMRFAQATIFLPHANDIEKLNVILPDGQEIEIEQKFSLPNALLIFYAK